MSEPLGDRPRIVVGVDGSRGSRQALRWTLRIARAELAACPVLVVHGDLAP